PVKGGEQAKFFSEQGSKLFKWNDWNTIVVRCEGNRIQTWLNGEKRVDFTDTDKQHDTRKGFIGLQVHHGAACNVSWRNLKLKELNTTK
ncbi:3-keto-disaccharide hydrolase, partial [Klebsiella pneumoniae]|uniref:3-keto-disaccharide hydrolase n=1 Tax=Klebsiella pneumoniae TaxID=573 RepID=UPI0030F45269